VKFERLRIIGFKTFVDPTDIVIEPGLTGIVGPNGCGKSNLVEALRWVMGETSHKSMRASSMDDVIFSGTTGRPSRNTAEVVLRIDNALGQAPAPFNDADTLEISRRIERDGGSIYRINGREARARDVQLLFADAASGARSPSLVKQGQIGEIIAAKPQARRRILEDAAGVAGLYSRRHEAELRLKAAEDNLTRTEDVLTHLDGQMEGLKRQARQALRYKELSAAIRVEEAAQLRLAVHAASQEAQAAQSAFDRDMQVLGAAIAAQGEAARIQAVADHELQPRREAETRASAALQRLLIARKQLDQEEERLKARRMELERRKQELVRDEANAKSAEGDAESALARIAEEEAALNTGESDFLQRSAALASACSTAEAALSQAEAAYSAAQSALAEASARRTAAERVIRDARERRVRAGEQQASAQRELAALENAAGVPAAALDALRSECEAALTKAAKAEQVLIAAEATLGAAREAETGHRPKLAEAERIAQRLDTEARTIRKLLDGGATDLWPPVIDQITVEQGYEIALAAALGDDLSASTNASAPAHWIVLGGISDAPLPEGAEALLGKVNAPPALANALGQIGIVDRAALADMRHKLLRGQMLVTREGDVARWDGFTSAADAPSAAARRLKERNRLADIEAEAKAALGKRDALRKAADEIQRSLREASAMEAEARHRARETRKAAEVLRERAARDERALGEQTARLLAIRAGIGRFETMLAEAAEALERAEAEGVAIPDASPLQEKLGAERSVVEACRVKAADARAAQQSLEREAAAARNRLASLNAEAKAWQDRRERAKTQILEIATRIESATTELEAIAAGPDDALVRRRALSFEIEKAEEARKAASDERAVAETALIEAEKAAREAMRSLGDAREARARSEAMLEAARVKQDSVRKSASDTLGIASEAVEGFLAAQNGAVDDIEGVEQRLADLRRERERIGAVNLRADEELADIENTRGRLTTEREELAGAIRKLRRAIETLNSEGRERLIAAFDVVNGHFKRLFSTLFEGGEADLTLIESDDPLEAGLEIIAKPPGKKPQVLTLLSGGEQALTATALIFAVFLTNPSPVCVLDEIDAPLDDANVERLCSLLDGMVKETDTRFITITHNPITMARMDRLFGVTMVEKGVSQLVSVDLSGATALAQAV
jgi:chromosome segregation protein